MVQGKKQGGKGAALFFAADRIASQESDNSRGLVVFMQNSDIVWNYPKRLIEFLEVCFARLLSACLRFFVAYRGPS